MIELDEIRGAAWKVHAAKLLLRTIELLDEDASMKGVFIVQVRGPRPNELAPNLKYRVVTAGNLRRQDINDLLVRVAAQYDRGEITEKEAVKES